MRTITLEELLEAGSHFGHQVTRHNPKSRDYVFEARDNIHIIDLAKTKEGLEEAAAFVKALASKEGSSFVILGAKRQADTIVKEEVKRAKDAGATDLYFVTARWIGGLLTNLPEVSKNFKKLKDLTTKLNNPHEKAKFTKKEISLWEKERQKLETFYSGVSDMTKLPDALFIIDTHLEDLAVREARATNVPVVGITDTNADPTIIDYPIPANDDAAGSIKLITAYIVDAWIEGKVAKNAKDAKNTNDAKEEGPEKRENGKDAKSTKEEAEAAKPKEKSSEGKEAKDTKVKEEAKKVAAAEKKTTKKTVKKSAKTAK